MIKIMQHQARLDEYITLINNSLLENLPESDLKQKKVIKSMRYSLNGGGKRLRPVLLLEFCRICGGDVKDALPFACAIECIHTYSLIHDDLPCMDDDMLRRGRPTNHVEFGEACAVLAGDALLNFAFELMLNNKNVKNLKSENVINAAYTIANASGAYGMIGGQILDIEAERKRLSLDNITLLQSLKTGAIIKAAAISGCILANADNSKIEAARLYSNNLGLAFQIRDDMLNVEGNSAELGKDVGNDERSGKSTFVKLLGLEGCREKVNNLTDEAVAAISELNDCGFLVWIAQNLANRNN